MLFPYFYCDRINLLFSVKVPVTFLSNLYSSKLVRWTKDPKIEREIKVED